jgi:hypothetical protein
MKEREEAAEPEKSNERLVEVRVKTKRSTRKKTQN